MTDEAATRHTRVGDIDVAWRLTGRDGAPVVMLSHGLLASHRLWDALSSLLEADWQVLRYDLRGHGTTSVTAGDYTLSQLAADAIGLLDALGLDRVHFIGLSLGGMLGQPLAARWGHRLHSLTLANTACVQGAPQVWQQRIDLVRAQGLDPIVSPTLERWFTPTALREQPDMVAAAGAIARRTAADGFLGGAAAVRDLSQHELAARITVPTLVIAGQYDQAIPVEASRVLAAAIAGARLQVLPAAHQSATECPQAFADTWLAFHRSLSP